MFWSKVDISFPDECWNWKGKLFSNGYGAFQLKGKDYIASRTSFQLTNNVELEKDIVVCHKCDNRSCCNPSHLFSGTQKDNLQDAIAKGRLGITPGYGDGRRILTNEDIVLIKEFGSEGYQQKEIASLFFVRPNHISRILAGKRRNK